MNDQEISQEDWRVNLAKIGAEQGFYEELGDEHTALFVKRGKTLIVTFENLDHVYDRGADKMPWGYGFVEANGWSMLGLMAHDFTWYRDEKVFDFFDELQQDGFFKLFDQVVFYGASMGAYAAATFSAAAPGATVVAISPQATLDREITSWETRYKKAWRRNYNSRYGYAPEQSKAAGAVHLFYDPLEPQDAMHAALFQGENVRKYRCRFMGHRIASLWIQIKLLKPIVAGCVDGSLTTSKFYAMMRARREVPRYQKAILGRLEQGTHYKLIAEYCAAVLKRRRAPHFRSAMKQALARLK